MISTSTLSQLFPQICKAIFEAPPESGAGQFWFVITNFWSQYWLLITIGMVLWITFEIFTMHGNAHFNSDNGFSPTFNRVVGSGTYLLFQTITVFLLVTIWGSGIYCTPWPYTIHPIIFGLTWLFLIKIRFWVY